MDIIKFNETETETESESECESKTINVNMTVLRPAEDGCCMVYLTKDNFNISVTENEYSKIFDAIERDGVVIKSIDDDVMKDCKLNTIIQEIERPVKKEYYIIDVKKCDAFVINHYPIMKHPRFCNDDKMPCYVTFLMPKRVRDEDDDFQIYSFVRRRCILILTANDYLDINNKLVVNKFYTSNTFNPLMKDSPFNEEIESYQYDTNMEYSILTIEHIDM
jgi:hypothetical protein